MKKVLSILSFFALAITFTMAQVKDTVSMGANYANMVWYDIENDVETKLPATSWDISISMVPTDAAIGVNANTTITYYQAVDSIGKWANIVASDTSKLIKPIYNSDSLFRVSAFNSTSKDNNVFDYGWGNYGQASRNIRGDSVYIIKTIKNEWKKIAFLSLDYDTMYTIKYANLDGSNEKIIEIKKKDYPKKNFIYFSVSENKVLNPEPDNDKWDLLFTKYHGLTPDPTGKLVNYPLIGVLQNNIVLNERGTFRATGATVAEIYRKDLVSNDFDQKKLRTEINTIGSEWKAYDGVTRTYTISDTTSYFLKNRNAKYFKVLFKDFLSTQGSFVFERKTFYPTSVKDVYNGSASLSVYPNPSNGNNLTVVYDLGKNAQNADFQLFTLTGQAVYTQKLQNTEGVQQLALPQLNLASGVYFAVMQWSGQSAIQKVIIR
jgi:Secretion system C-terminal sorting domain